MSDTPTQATPELVATAITTEALHFDGDAICKLANLGAKATGIEILKIDDLIPGLPINFPLAIVHGDAPKLLSVKALAEEWRDRPERRAGRALVLTLDSFCDLVNRHRLPGTAVFVDSQWKSPSMTGVIDYHDDVQINTVASHGGHRVHYSFPLSEEWKDWVQGDGEPMKQGDFAAMIEDRIADLAAPMDATKIWLERDFQTTVASPSQLVTLSRGLQVNVEAKVKDTKTLQTGEGQVVFEETHSGADGQPLRIPGLFVLRIAPFFEGEKVEVPVRLRYRVRDGKVVWFYQIYRPDMVITETIRHAMGDVREKTGCPVYEGAPEMDGQGRPVGR